MLNWPEWFKMPTIDNLSSIGEKVLMVALGKHILIVLTGYVNTFGVSMFQTSIGEGKILARNTQFILYGNTAITYLMFQFLNIVIRNTIMIQCMSTKQKTSLLQILDLLPCHRMLSGTFCSIYRKILNVIFIIRICCICKMRIYKNNAFTPYFSSCGAI